MAKTSGAVGGLLALAMAFVLARAATAAPPVPPPEAPAVSTLGASNIDVTAATFSGDLSSLGNAASVAVSFLWGTQPGSYAWESAARVLTVPGHFYVDVGSLQPDTVYYFTVKAVGGGNIVYGAERSFRTEPIVVIDLYEATFTIADFDSGARIQGAMITVADLDIYTNADGQASVRNLEAGNYAYTVVYADYPMLSGSFNT